MSRKVKDEIIVTDAFEALNKYLQDEETYIEPARWFLDTGNLALNYIVSGHLKGGWPSGQVCEVFGDPSTGKTLMLMKAVAAIQKEGGLAIVNDVEHRWDWDFARVHGVDDKRVIKTYPETIEDWSLESDKLLDEILKQEPPIPRTLICLDSVASLSTYWEMENVGTKEDQGKKAKRIKAAMRVLPKKIARAGATLIASNHLIADPRITYGSNLITPGGKGVTFQSTVRVEMHKPIMITPEGKNRPIGTTLRFVCVKNSITPPYGKCDINVFWSAGIDRFSGLLDMMIDMEIVQQAGGWYEYRGSKFRAKDLEPFIKEHPEILEDEKWAHPYFLEG